ncbi:MAG: hypothetical protein AAGB26_14785 [Planctomycetota bacterium]
MICLASPVHAEQAQQDAAPPSESDTRPVEVERLAFSITAPAHWQLKLNERIKMFLHLQETNDDGALLPANLNIQYRPSQDKPYPQIPDADAYAEIIVASSKADMPDIEIVNTTNVALSGYEGVMVSFTATIRGMLLRMDHYNVVHPEGKDSFVVTAGTLNELWDESEETFSQIISTIKLDAGKE